MNLVKQFKAFGELAMRHSIPMDVQALYYNLLQFFNRNMWPPTLVIETYRLEDACAMTRKRIGQCREYLIEKGMISYEQSSYASGSPTYSLVFLYETHGVKYVFPHETQESDSVFPDETPNVSQGNTKETQSVSPRNTFNKTYKTTKTENIIEPNGSMPGTGKKKKAKIKKPSRAAKMLAEIEATPHWQLLVAEWFDFNEKNTGIKPSFKGRDPKAMKQLVDNLKKRSEDKKHEWTAEVAVNTFRSFLQYAYGEDWLKHNFLLHNLETQFDKIIANAKQASNKYGPGANNSAFEAIDRMYQQSNT